MNIHWNTSDSPICHYVSAKLHRIPPILSRDQVT